MGAGMCWEELRFALMASEEWGWLKRGSLALITAEGWLSVVYM